MRISDWSSDVCSSDLVRGKGEHVRSPEMDLRSFGGGAAAAGAAGLELERPACPGAGRRGLRRARNLLLPLCGRAVDGKLQGRQGTRHVGRVAEGLARIAIGQRGGSAARLPHRSEEHTSELQSLMRISYAVFCLKKKIHKTHPQQERINS